jgi:hypothetical protein
MATKIRNIVAPNLPTAPVEYQQRYQDQFTNILRLYFNQVSNNVNAPRPFGSFYDTTTQTNPVANAVNLMKVNSTYDSGNGANFSIQKDTNKIFIGEDGVYNIQFSAQLDKTGGGNTSIYIWIRVNGVNVSNSASKMVISGPNDEKIAAWNWMLLFRAGDYFELAWSSPSTDAVLLAEAATSVIPEIPSVIITAQWVSNIPASQPIIRAT